MDEIQDYYVLLGVSDNASMEEIKRAYTRKRREYQNDEDKSTQLNQAYEVLCDSAKRKQYDLNMQYGNQVKDIKEKIQNSETLEQRDKYLIEARKIYLDILKKDAENADALWNLVGIEELLGNDIEAIQYLKQLEKCEEGDDKLQVYHRLGEIYRKLGKIDEAIKCYHAIYKADVAYVEDIKILVRLCYEDKKNLKAAIQILNDCINRSADARLKIVYLYETLRAIRLLNVSSYQKVEDTLYKKLETFHTADEESNLANAATILSCFEDVLNREDYECFHRMEKIYLSYNIKHTELNQAFISVQQIIALMENGKIHKAIELYLEEQWTKEIKEQIGRLIIKEAEQIKASLEIIKKEAPEYWKTETELADLENLVNENLKISKEFNSLSNDRTISYYMKKMMECILLDGFVAFEDMKDEFIEARDSFFDKEDRGKFEHTLRKMEECYPLCYKLFADIFFEGKSIEELTLESNGKVENQSARPNMESNKINNNGMGYLLAYFIGGVLLVAAFPLGLIVLIVTYRIQTSNQSNTTEAEKRAEQERKRQEELEKKKRSERRKKIFKRVCIIAGIIYVAVIAFNIGTGIKERIELKREQEYLESHNIFLTEEELKECTTLEEKYDRKTDVDIHVAQAHVNNSLDYPDEPYIWLIIWDYGYQTGYELKSNYLSDEEKNALWKEIETLHEGDETDKEKCEKFYELAYAYIGEHEENIVEVPELLGLTVTQAEKILEKHNLYISVENYEYSSEYAVDTIMSQYPAISNKIEKGQIIYVAISLGEEPKQVIDNNHYYEEEEYTNTYYDIIDGRHLNLDGKGEIIIKHISENEILAEISLTNICDFSIVLEKINGIYTYTNGNCYIIFSYDEGFNLQVSCSGEKTEEFPYWEEMCEIFSDAVFALGG